MRAITALPHCFPRQAHGLSADGWLNLPSSGDPCPPRREACFDITARHGWGRPSSPGPHRHRRRMGIYSPAALRRASDITARYKYVRTGCPGRRGEVLS
jgi:hypothetical protein